MIKHIVMWRLHEQAEGNDRATNARLVKQKLEALRGRIPQLRAIEVGIDVSVTDSSADVILYSEFESLEALEAYQAHPEHVALKDFMRAVTAERRLVDYEI